MRRLALSFTLLVLACQPAQEERDPLHELTRHIAGLDTVTLAAELYEPETFDTVSWASEAHLLARGGQVFEASCSKCHGADGAGGRVKYEGELIEGPSLRGADWDLAGWETGIRQVVFTGTPDGMPHWGMKGLRYRDVEAVAAYINRELRQAPVEADRVPTPVLPREIAGY